MRVLVTGGSGYVGRVVVDCLAREHDVAVYDRMPPAAGVEFIEGDILDLDALRAAMSGVEGVVHLAAIPVPFREPDDTVMMVNVIGCERVVAAASEAGVSRLVAAGSDSAFGFVFSDGKITPEYLPVDERHPARPADAYGLSKLIDEEICRRYTRLSAIETVCLRYCWVWSEREYEAIGTLQAQPESFVGQLWGYIDVRDVARGCSLALAAPDIAHETLLLSARRTFMDRPTADLVRRYLPETVSLDEAWLADDPRRSLLDCSRAAAVLGFEPEFDWEACV